ncbi:PfkB family carbohydrate kinase [Bosea sp. LjRoot90]|uniref:carbohydrate kinase family protein n=1 Tax=Bosea sp. LjRoot90 TaxID=3342342 RepID=UPI003ED13356
MTGKGVLVYGEALVDIVPGSAGHKREAVLGGSGFNTALALARCGAPVTFNVNLSRDTLGQLFLRRLTEEGIDRRFVGVCDAPTPSATVTSIDAEGAATYRFSLHGTAFDAAPPVPADLNGFAHLHVTSFGATIGASGAAALALMRRAREAGLSVSYDLNIRPAVLPALAKARRAIEERAVLCDLLKCSSDDARAVHGPEFGYTFARWFAQGGRLLLVTDGEKGGYLLPFRREPMPFPALAQEVVDTIGAGDSFMGAFLASLWRNGGLGPVLHDLPDELCAAALGFAAVVAAETCAERGYNPPRLDPPSAHD